MRTIVAFLLLSAVVAAQDRPRLDDVLRQGARLVEAGQLTAAQELYEESLRGFPANPDLTFELGMVYFRQRNWARAVENFKSSLSSKPGRVKPLFYLAEAYYMESDLDLARDSIGQAAHIAPNDPQVCQKYGEYLAMTVETRREGLTWLQKARRLSPSLPRIDFDIGKAQFDLTDFPAAASSFEAALKSNSSDGQAAFFLAEAWATLSEWEKARERYNYALAEAYTNGLVYYGLGKSLVEMGEYKAAIAPLEQALALQPSLIQAHFQLARAYRQLGQTEEARHEAQLFSAMTDRIDTSRELKGSEEENAWKQVKPLLEANKEQEALKLLGKLRISEGSDREEVHYLLGIMYYNLGREEDARRVLNIARGAAPKSARIAAYLGFVELSSGDAVSAEESFEAALALDSREVLALIGMGVIQYRKQRWAGAAEYLEKSRTADPDTLYMLCDAYFRINRREDALVTAEVIRAFGSENKSLLDAVDSLIRLHTAGQQSPAQ